jgi:hypothetical protein
MSRYRAPSESGFSHSSCWSCPANNVMLSGYKGARDASKREDTKNGIRQDRLCSVGAARCVCHGLVLRHDPGLRMTTTADSGQHKWHHKGARHGRADEGGTDPGCRPRTQRTVGRHMRDDFPKAVVETLAKRVGNRCSNPGCRKRTSGPHTGDEKALNVGVAAHVIAASPSGH